MDTVNYTVNHNLCISCGLCKAVCPKSCIYYEDDHGLNVPHIIEKECISCGKCFDVCPGKGFNFKKYIPNTEGEAFWEGNYISLYSAWTKNAERRRNAVSGGIITELISNLLSNQDYDAAFLVDTHQFLEHQVESHYYEKEMELLNTQKSRYLPISHEKAISYMIKNRTKRIILVGTSCFIEGVLNVISTYHLERTNYFLIGLFCDKTMNFNVVDYFKKHPSLKNKKMNQLFFRTKEVGGWPGGVQLRTIEGENINLSNKERMKVKEYFQPERCMYCLDKLNRFADISVGDNYTGKNSDTLGSNSVIIRTQRGKEVWNKYANQYQWKNTTIEEIRKSQHLNKRKDNYCFAKIKEQKTGNIINITDDLFAEIPISIKMKLKYYLKRLKIMVGNHYNTNPYLLNFFLLWKNFKIKIKKLTKRS